MPSVRRSSPARVTRVRSAAHAGLVLLALAALALLLPASAAAGWTQLGSAAPSENGPRAVTVHGGQTYVGTVESNTPRVRRWNGTSWEQVGGIIQAPVGPGFGDDFFSVDVYSGGGKLWAVLLWTDVEVLGDWNYLGLYELVGSTWTNRGEALAFENFSTHDEYFAGWDFTHDGTNATLVWSRGASGGLGNATTSWINWNGFTTTTGALNTAVGDVAITTHGGNAWIVARQSSTLRSWERVSGTWTARATMALGSAMQLFGAASTPGGLTALVKSTGSTLRVLRNTGAWAILGPDLAATSGYSVADARYATSSGVPVAAWVETKAGTDSDLRVASQHGATWVDEASPVEQPMTASVYAYAGLHLWTQAGDARVGTQIQGNRVVFQGTLCAAPAPCTPRGIAPRTYTGSASPQLTASDFVDLSGDGHAASQWQLRTDSGSWASPLADSGTTASDLTTWTVPAALADGVDHYWRVRYRDAAGNWSAWSADTLLIPDLSGPATGSVEHPNGALRSQWPVTFSASDGESGLLSTQLQYDTAPYGGIDSGCGAWADSWTNLGSANWPSPYVHATFTTPTCYRYRLVATDKAGNASTFTSEDVTIALPPLTAATLTGFEHQRASGSGLYSSVAGSVSIDTTTPRHGAAALRVAPAGSAAYARLAGDGVGAGASARLALRLSSLPAATVELAALTTPTGVSVSALRYHQPSGTLQLVTGAGVGTWTLGAVQTDRWYVIELAATSGAVSNTSSWMVDGVAQGTVSGAGTSAVVDELRLGTAAAGTYTALYDDVILTNAGSDLPIGNGAVLAYRPMNNGGKSGGGNFEGCDGSGCTPTSLASETTSWTYLDDSPLGATDDWISQSVVSTGSFVEYQFEDTSEPLGPRAVQPIVQVRATASGANQLCARHRGSSATYAESWPGCASSPRSTGTAGTYYWSDAFATRPAGGMWTIADLNAFRLRIGYSNDITPRIYVDAAMFEADHQLADPAPAVPLAPPASVDDGDTLGADVDVQTNGDTLEAVWSPVTHLDFASYDYCFSASATGADCATTALKGWTSTTGTSATLGAQTLADGSTWYACVRSVDTGAAVTAATCSDGVTVDLPDTISVSLDSGSLALGMGLSGTDSVGSVVTTVTSTFPGGTTVSVRDEHDSWALDCSCGAQIPDWTGTDAAPTAWAAGAGGWAGITVRAATGGRLAKWGSGTGTAEDDFVANRFAGVRASSDTVLHQWSGPVADATVTSTFRVNVAPSQKTGSYDGTLVYSVVGTP